MGRETVKTLLLIGVGAALACAWGDYHNEHVNMLAGGYLIKQNGFVLLATAGGFAGFFLSLIVGRKQ